MAVMPVPRPVTTPHRSQSCQMLVMAVDTPSPTTIVESAIATIVLTPKRWMRAAEKGAISPNRRSRTASAPEMELMSQPNSFCSGMMSTPRLPMAAAVATMVRKVTATIAHP